MFKDGSLASALLLCGLAVGATDANAEDPTIARLIENVRNVTTADPGVKAFRMRLTTSVPFGMPFETTAMWRKEGAVGLLTTAGEGKSPVWLLSESKAAIFDVGSGAVLVKEQARLNLDLRFGEEELKLDYGIASGDEDRVDVRFRPLFDHPDFREGSLSRTDSGDYVLASKVTKRGYQTIAIFDSAEPHALRGFEIKRVAGGEVVLRVDDLRFDDEVGDAWPGLPASETLPEGVRAFGPGRENGAPEASTQRLWLMRSQLGYAAIQDEKLRQSPILKDVDWEAAIDRSRSLAPLGKSLTAAANAER